MSEHYIEAKILDINAKNLGINLDDFYKQAGKEIAKMLVAKFGLEKSYAVICGLGGNGGDGFSLAFELTKLGVKKVNVYLVGRASLIENPNAVSMWERLINISQNNNLEIKQDCYAPDIQQSDVVIESLIGTGLHGDKLNKRFHDVIRRISHFDSPLIAVDAPCPHYKPDAVYSLIYPKTQNALVIELKIPKELSLYVGPGESEVLQKPKKTSHKNKNGKILVVHNTSDVEVVKQNVSIAKEYECFVYILNLNKEIYKKTVFELKDFDNFEMVNEGEEDIAILNSDAILMGNFDNISLVNRAVVNEIMDYKGRTHITFGNALNYIHPNKFKNLSVKPLIIPTREQLQKFVDDQSKNKNIEASAKRLAIEYDMNIINLATQTTLYSAEGDFKLSRSANVFDPYFGNKLATRIAAYSTLNDLWLSMRAGCVDS